MDDEKPEMMDPAMMEEAPLMGERNTDEPGPGDYVEKNTFCYCFTTKCGLITMAILLVIDFFLEVITVIQYSQNEHIESTFIMVYVLLVILIFVAAILVFIYLVGTDSPGIRALLPWGFLLASIANFLIALWIIVYFFGMYPEDKVYVTRAERGEQDTYVDDEGETQKKPEKYTKVNKAAFVMQKIFSPIINGLAYLIFYCYSKDWVERH